MDREQKEHRSDEYSFQSQENLISFFSQWLDEPVISDVVGKMKKNFVKRRGSVGEEARLQYLKKCQFALMERLGAEIKLP